VELSFYCILLKLQIELSVLIVLRREKFLIILSNYNDFTADLNMEQNNIFISVGATATKQQEDFVLAIEED
jgi:hypothetical protein